MRIHTLLAAFVVSAFTGASAEDSVPLTMSHSGRLLDGADVAVDGPKTFVFAIHKLGAPPPAGSSEDDTALWTDTFEVTLHRGFYQVDLGAQKPLPVQVFGGTRFLAVTVDGVELEPRMRIGTSPYAFRAADALTLGGRPATSFADADHTHDDLYAAKDATYTKAEADAAIAALGTNIETTLAGHYTKEEAAGLFAAKDAAYTKDEADGLFAKNAALADVATSGAYADLSGTPDLDVYARLDASNTFTGANTFAGGIDLAGSQAKLFRLQNAATEPAPCNADAKGMAWYDTSDDSVRVCNGLAWRRIAAISGKEPGSQENPAESCLALRDALPGARSGTYHLDADGSGPKEPFPAWCDMEFAGGGWLSVYNQPAAAYTPAQMHAALSAANQPMTAAQTPTTTSAAIFTKNLDLSRYQQVVYGWAPLNQTVTRWAAYNRPQGLVGACHVDGFCGNYAVIATMMLQPQGISVEVKTGSDPSYPHVGIGWSGQQILWGYDRDANGFGNWANIVSSSCCTPASNAEVQQDGWRYVIYVR